MATQYKTRIRQAPVPGGVHKGVRAAGRYYNVDPTLISIWIKKGKVALAGPVEPGTPLPIDDASLRRRLQSYTPDKDNQARKRRSRTIPEMQAEARTNGLSNGHQSNGHTQAARADGASPLPNRPAAPTPAAGRRTDAVVVLNAREWVDKFYTEQARSLGGELNPKTKGSYDWTLDRFVSQFPTVPLERKTVLDYILGLTNLKKGGPLSNGAKGRGVTPPAVRGGFGEGGMVGAAEAVKLGMADRIGTLETAISRAAGGRGGFRAEGSELEIATENLREAIGAMEGLTDYTVTFEMREDDPKVERTPDGDAELRERKLELQRRVVGD